MYIPTISNVLCSEELFVALGGVFRNAKDAQIIVSQKVIIHPKYLSSGGRNDIGVVKLATAAKLGRYQGGR